MKPLKRYTKYAFGIVMLVVFLLVAVNEGRSQDHDIGWAQARFCVRYAWDGSCAQYRYRRFRNHTYHLPERHTPRVYSYVYRHDDGENCKALRRVVGEQHLTVDGAKKAANDNWAGAVRFHHGEKYIDLSNAKGITYVCSRSSVKEAGVTTLGQTLSRCELEAIPCRPQKEEER